jgi:hypothetical protein
MQITNTVESDNKLVLEAVQGHLIASPLIADIANLLIAVVAVHYLASK